MTINEQQNDILNSFIIEVRLINPIEKILLQLDRKEFRDCDIKWLNDRLVVFSKLAMETLHKKIEVPEIIVDGIMNEYNYKRFREYFTSILNYFKSF